MPEMHGTPIVGSEPATNTSGSGVAPARTPMVLTREDNVQSMLASLMERISAMETRESTPASTATDANAFRDTPSSTSSTGIRPRGDDGIYLHALAQVGFELLGGELRAIEDEVAACKATTARQQAKCAMLERETARLRQENAGAAEVYMCHRGGRRKP